MGEDGRLLAHVLRKSAGMQQQVVYALIDSYAVQTSGWRPFAASSNTCSIS
jgi:hypothetical protein